MLNIDLKEFINFKNIKRGWLTTLLGLIIIGWAIFKHQPGMWTDTILGVVFGLGLFFLPGPGKGSTPAGGAVAGMLMLLFLLSSCITYEKCIDKYGITQGGTRDTLETSARVPYVVPLPGDSIYKTFDLDSLKQAVADSIGKSITDTLRLKGKNSKAEALFWMDRYNKLHALFRVPPDTARGEATAVIRVPYECPPIQSLPAEPPLTFWQQIWYEYTGFAAIAFGIVMILLLAHVIFKRYK